MLEVVTLLEICEITFRMVYKDFRLLAMLRIATTTPKAIAHVEALVTETAHASAGLVGSFGIAGHGASPQEEVCTLWKRILLIW